MSWNLPDGCTDADIDRAYNRGYDEPDEEEEDDPSFEERHAEEEEYQLWCAWERAEEDEQIALACVGRTTETTRRPPQSVKSLNAKERSA